MLGLGQWVEHCNLTRLGVQVYIIFFFLLHVVPTQCFALVTKNNPTIISSLSECLCVSKLYPARWILFSDDCRPFSLATTVGYFV